MPYVTIEDRVDRLEAAFGQFLTELAVSNKRAEERNRQAEERNRQAEERMARFEGEMREFKDEMREFKDEMRSFKKESHKSWGDLANRLGTIIEDILAPNLRRLAIEHFNFASIEAFVVRIERKHPTQPGRSSEFDTIVIGPDAVILGEAKTVVREDSGDAFAAKAREFFDYFPELRGRRLILVLGSWSIPDPVLKQLTRLGIYGLRAGDETMELANAAALEATG